MYDIENPLEATNFVEAKAIWNSFWNAWSVTIYSDRRVASTNNNAQFKVLEMYGPCIGSDPNSLNATKCLRIDFERMNFFYSIFAIERFLLA